MKKLLAIGIIAILGCGSYVWSQTDQPAKPFTAGVNLGTDVLSTGPGGTPESWTQIGFQPDVAFGKFGVGLNLTLHFQIYPVNQPDQAVAIYPGDWVPNYQGNNKNIIDLYLPKILYVRYGLKGVDPLFVKVGAIGDLSLGNGFIMGNYSNMSFFPDTRITGIDFGLDGTMFQFPYVGFEFLTGNLARFDVIGAHVLARPMIWSDIPIVKNLQVGLTFVTDTQPALYATTTSTKNISVYGLDASVPVLSNPAVSMAAFTEAAVEPNGSSGFMLGVGGKLISFFTYGLQLRLMGAGFIPTYFDANYDIYRAAKANYMALTPSGSGFAGWFASIGTSILGDKIAANASLDGPIAAAATDASQTAYPHARAVAHLGEGLLPGIYADASYEKYYLGQVKGFFGDLIDPTNAIVGLAINYKTGSSVLTLMYNAKWLNNSWKVSSSLQASLKF